MNKTDTHTEFRKKLLKWHNRIDRKLPWKNTKDPYKIWLSEIILQQTRVAQGKTYYEKFISRFPTVSDLANASEDEVLALWKGLGYYARARNLHAAAQQVSGEFKGRFPKKYRDILSLKGVGSNTASAIASFAFGIPHAVLDGNVFRVLSRVFGIDTPIDATRGKKEFDKLANELLDQKKPGDYNQAIMDFGALHCKPKDPLCEKCVMMDICVAHKENKVELLPFKEKKIKVRSRYFNYFLSIVHSKILLIKRQNKDIWQGLYELPMIESQKQLLEKEVFDVIKNKYGQKNLHGELRLITNKKQRLTHQWIYGTFYQVDLGNCYEKKDWKSLEEVEKLGMPKIVDDFIKELKDGLFSMFEK